jgi:hypothetical protein
MYVCTYVRMYVCMYVLMIHALEGLHLLLGSADANLCVRMCVCVCMYVLMVSLHFLLGGADAFLLCMYVLMSALSSHECMYVCHAHNNSRQSHHHSSRV